MREKRERKKEKSIFLDINKYLFDLDISGFRNTSLF